MQKLKIGGKVYDLAEAIPKTSLHTLLIMKRDYGWTMPKLAVLANRLDKLTDHMAVLEDEELLEGFLVIIWLARRHAGEKVTLEESSNEVRLDELEMVDDDPKPEPEPDPKDRTDSGPGGAVPPPPLQPPTI